MQTWFSNLLRWMTILLLVASAACSNQNLGDIDETMSERDDMSGPGVFAKEDGKPVLSWTIGDDDTAATTQTTSVTGASATQATVSTTTDKAEFEQYKTWKELREQGSNSAEYREFQQWLEYQKFKTAE